MLQNPCNSNKFHTSDALEASNLKMTSETFSDANHTFQLSVFAFRQRQSFPVGFSLD